MGIACGSVLQEYEKLKSTSESDEENDSAQGQEKNDCLGQPGRLNTGANEIRNILFFYGSYIGVAMVCLFSLFVFIPKSIN